MKITCCCPFVIGKREVLTLNTHHCCQSQRYRPGRQRSVTLLTIVLSLYSSFSDSSSVWCQVDGERGKQVLRGPQDGNVSLVKQGLILSTEHSICFHTNMTITGCWGKWKLSFLFFCLQRS